VVSQAPRPGRTRGRPASPARSPGGRRRSGWPSTVKGWVRPGGRHGARTPGPSGEAYGPASRLEARGKSGPTRQDRQPRQLGRWRPWRSCPRRAAARPAARCSPTALHAWSKSIFDFGPGLPRPPGSVLPRARTGRPSWGPERPWKGLQPAGGHGGLPKALMGLYGAPRGFPEGVATEQASRSSPFLPVRAAVLAVMRASAGLGLGAGGDTIRFTPWLTSARP
jgi:hypothetical protein